MTNHAKKNNQFRSLLASVNLLHWQAELERLTEHYQGLERALNAEVLSAKAELIQRLRKEKHIGIVLSDPSVFTLLCTMSFISCKVLAISKDGYVEPVIWNPLKEPLPSFLKHHPDIAVIHPSRVSINA